MRILYCNKYNFPFSGTEVYLFALMDLMRAHGHETALFSMADPRGEATEYDQHFVPHVEFKDGNLGLAARAKLAGHVIYSTEARHRLRKMIAAFRPDVAHVRNIYHQLSPSVLWELKAQGVPVIYHLNDFKLLCPAYNMVAHGRSCEACSKGRFINVIVNNCYPGGRSAAAVLVAEAYVHRWLGTYQKCVDQFIAPSQFVKQKLVENDFDQSKIRVIPHFQRVPEQPPSLPAADAPILYFGRLSAEKGVADLVHAVQHVPDVRLQIAGDGPQRQPLQKLAQELHLTNIEFLGQLSGAELDDAIASSRFTVLPSLAYETLGKSILESYAWGRPVIASDLGSRRELVRDGETGLLYEPGNVRQLAETITHLARHPQMANTMGAAGRRWVETEHTAEKHYEAMAGVYHDLVHVQPGRVILDQNKRRRVAFIGARGVVSKYSGIESYYEEVGPRLAQMGYEVTIYCRSYFTPDLAIYKGMRLVRLPTIRTKHLETVVHTLLSTIHAMFSRCDIVHYHAQGSALFASLPKLTGKKTVVTVQGLDWQRKKWGRFAASVLQLGEWASVHLPDRTMVVSKALRERYRTMYGKETVYVPNGTTIRERAAGLQLGGWGLDPDKYVLFLGRFSPEKNCDLLVHAYEQLDTPGKLVLAGGSSHTDRYAAELGRHASDQVRFLNWVSGDALNELLTNAALFVLPSDLEGLSLALLDAMGAGVCVLTSDIPENRELVDGVGFTFRPGDAEDLARMLGLLLADGEIRKAAGESARRRIQESYLWPEVTQQVSEVYQELMGAKPRRKPPLTETAQPTPVKHVA